MSEFSARYDLVTPAGTVEFNRFDLAARLQLSRVDGLDAATLRTTSTPLVARDGELVQDAYSRGRYPVLAGQVVAAGASEAAVLTSRQTLIDSLLTALASIRRADGTLKWTPSSGAPARQLTVRAWESPQIGGGFLKEFQFGLVAANPTLVAQTLESDDSSLLNVAAGAGTWAFGNGGGAAAWALGDGSGVASWSLGSGASPGLLTLTNDGNADAWPILRIQGQVGGFVRVVSLTTGDEIVFSSLTVNNGHYAEIDTWAETAYLDGQSNQTLLGGLDAANSVFFPLVPGSNSLQLYADSFDGSAKLTVLHRDSFV